MISWLTMRRVVALAAVYVATAGVALLLAIPPGYASPVWPPAGIALVALLAFGDRLWPGVFVGSLVVNTLVGVSEGSVGAASATAAGIAVGATLQALVGANLVRWALPGPLELIHARDVGLFLLLGGLLACVTNATCSVALLVLTGAVPLVEGPFTWWTWWVGDTVGVLVVAPLALVAVGSPAEVWRRRRASIVLPLALIFGLVVAFFEHSAWEEARLRSEFEARAQRIAAAVARALDGTTAALDSIEAHFAASEEVTGAAFRAVAERHLRRLRHLVAISWDPIVPASGRAAFEAQLHAGLTEVDPQGALRPARARDEHVVVRFIEPGGANGVAVGLDIASDPVRADALRRARASRRPAATAPIVLVQDADPARPPAAPSSRRQPGVVVYLPVLRGEVLEGYLAAVLRTGDFLDVALEGTRDEDIGVALDDEGRRLATSSAWALATEPSDPRAFVARRTLDVAGRPWTFTCRATPGYMASVRSWRSWTVLAAGLGFVAALGGFLLIATGGAIRIERLGDERAAELSAVADDLRREVSERKLAEAALGDKEEQLRRAQKLEVIGRLAGGVAHDFNNILMAILIHGRLVGEALPAGSPLHESVAAILEAGERATRLTRQLLSLSRRQALLPRVLDLNALITDIVRVLARALGEDIRLVTTLAPGLGLVRADPGQLEQVLMNLAMNARQAMPGGGSLTIETADVQLDASGSLASRRLPDGVVGLPAGPYVQLSVSDTGVGMPPEVVARLFEPFFTTKEHGTGLGLSIVSGIVRQAGGAVTVTSAPGGGSVFRVVLPRVEGPVEAPPSAASAAAPARASAVVLLVEDDATVRRLEARILLDAGYDVLVAGSGEEALALSRARREPIHAVVSDVIMPGMSGIELVRALLGERPGLQVILVSGYSDDNLSGGVPGGGTFIQKPFHPEALLGALRAKLTGAEARAHVDRAVGAVTPER